MRRMSTSDTRRIALSVLAAALVPLTIAGCGGSKEGGTAGETGAAQGAGTTGAMPAPGGAAPAGTTATGAAGGGNTQPSSITPQMVALGDSIFHGQAAGGTCQTCHGPNAKGTQLAPDLTDSKWISGDGSYAFVINTDIHGVPNPSPPYVAPMPPMGGASLSPDQIRAVAAYVYSLSHPNVGK